MIAYTIEAALQSGISDRVYVCTESEEIANISHSYGAKIHFVDKEMAGDLVSSTVPCLDLLEKLESEGSSFDYLMNLQPTSPLRNSEDIVRASKKIVDEEADFLVSVTPIDPHYFHWAIKEENGNSKLFFGRKFLKERPLLPTVYRPNGAIKLGNVDPIKKLGHFFGDSLVTHEMPEERSIHVSNEFDLKCVKGILNETK